MSNEPAIIIKKVKKGGGHGHHGGAWKVAYADFVTAMMAFFLLMWLINTTTPEQKRGIAEYFAPASLSSSRSGAGGVLGGTDFVSGGARHGGSTAITAEMAVPRPQNQGKTEGKKSRNDSDGSAGSKADSAQSAAQKAMQERESFLFEQAEISLRQALQDNPDLAELSKHVLIDQTPEGLRIQLVDQDGRSMFDGGSDRPNPRVERLLGEVAKILDRLPNRIAITGHTDAEPVSDASGGSNWELSSNRANTTRRILQNAGLKGDRVYQVSGKADSEPLFPDDPYLPANRRIGILLMREAPVLPPGHRL